MDNINFESLKNGIPKGTYEQIAVRFNLTSNYIYKIASGKRARVDILRALLNASKRHKARMNAIKKDAEALFEQ